MKAAAPWRLTLPPAAQAISPHLIQRGFRYVRVGFLRLRFAKGTPVSSPAKRTNSSDISYMYLEVLSRCQCEFMGTEKQSANV